MRPGPSRSIWRAAQRRAINPARIECRFSLLPTFGGRTALMTMRTTNKTITFHQPFRLEGVDGVLPPADYRVVTDEEILEGLSFVAYHRVATSIFVPAPFGSAVEMVAIDPSDLEAAQAEDLIMHEMQPVDRVLLAPNVA